MPNYPFDPQLQSELTKLYHDFIKSATDIIKNSQYIDFSKVEIEMGKSYYCDNISETKCESACFSYENFLLTSASCGVERWI